MTLMALYSATKSTILTANAWHIKLYVPTYPIEPETARERLDALSQAPIAPFTFPPAKETNVWIALSLGSLERACGIY